MFVYSLEHEDDEVYEKGQVVVTKTKKEKNELMKRSEELNIDWKGCN